jgi:zinc transport system substrate-binding protein
MRLAIQALSALTVLLCIAPAAAAPKVVATIAPIHSLAAGVMEGVAEPRLLLRPGASPHGFALRPSDARALAEADLVIWVGESLEQFLIKPLQTLAGAARHVELLDVPGMTVFPVRTGPRWSGRGEERDHDDYKAAHDDEDETAHDDEDEDGHEDGQRHDHVHSGADPHLWLDPVNGRAIVAAIAAALTQIDPVNAMHYAANAERLDTHLDALDRELRAKMRLVASRPFMVYHDGYQYFERRYGLNALGAVTASPELQPSAKRVSELRASLGAAPGACLFSEPQFSPSLTRVLADESSIRLATLDPLGADIAPGPDAYFRTVENLAASLHDCLAALP